MNATRANGLGAWTKRLGFAVLAGVAAGMGTALVGLRILEGDAPPPVVVPDEPVVETPAPRRTIRGPRADGMRPGASAMVGGGALASRDSVAVVPDLVGRAEGDARRLLERAGFTVGDILFRGADERVGTVLETFPVRGERVQLPATVNLILADRRREEDPVPAEPVVDSSRSERRPDEMITDSLFLIPDTSRATGLPDTLRPLPDSLP